MLLGSLQLVSPVQMWKRSSDGALRSKCLLLSGRTLRMDGNPGYHPFLSGLNASHYLFISILMYLSGAPLLEELGVIVKSCNRCLQAEVAALGYRQEVLLVTTCNHVNVRLSFTIF